MKNSFSYFILAGLFFSLLGDTVLLFAPLNELFFIAGLVMFLVAHVFYILAFRLTDTALPHSYSSMQLFISTIPFILISTGVFLFLKDSLGALMIPVIAYISVITLMGITAALRYKKVSDKSFNLILAGAILFMASDTLIAVNKFYSPLPQAGVLIMGTYILAQYLIVKGRLDQIVKGKN